MRAAAERAQRLGGHLAAEARAGMATAATASPPLSSSSSATAPYADVYIVGAARTPLGAFCGGLAHLSAVELGAHAVRAALGRARAPPGAFGKALLGNVCSAGLGQAPARQAALAAGLLPSCDATAVNNVCVSGLKTVALAAQAIALGQHVVVAGGFESMSDVP
jgi:acetyl-CoA C-acetyltransferase